MRGEYRFTEQANVREVLLSTIRGRLQTYDPSLLRSGFEDDQYLRWIAGHALNAALACGATEAEVDAAADAIFAKLEPDEEGLDWMASSYFGPTEDEQRRRMDRLDVLVEYMRGEVARRHRKSEAAS